ncbi:uncharacterized protein B0T15DRAFT_511161 [Chaetomium strumarium]|uniref:NmrA-like domain-containing protein n=1 Tax=Chaetomium strumarium TaxID=1170767 RepID=A0AAJ0M188_9PEZI|nr:hypothetical protein B0T15DRAFT_511161 [Chaetomium strumarium]
MAKIVTVVGATGQQGQGVVSAFINNPAYRVRAITRNPSSAAAQALSAQGAEVVSANLDDLASLKTAFAGSHIVFAVTNFLDSFVALGSLDKAMDAETAQGINVARAAAATLPTLEHYIWSTLPNAKALSAGKHPVPHFESKNRVDAYIREREPDLLRKTTFLWVGNYHSNYRSPCHTPNWIPSTNKFIQFGSFAPDTPLLSIGDVTRNLGPFVKAAVEQPEKTANGGIVLAVTETYTADGLLQLWARVKGTKAQFVQVGKKDYREMWPVVADVVGAMIEYWDDVRDRSWTDPDGRKVLTKDDLGVQGLQSLEEAFKELELSRFDGPIPGQERTQGHGPMTAMSAPANPVQHFRPTPGMTFISCYVPRAMSKPSGTYFRG